MSKIIRGREFDCVECGRHIVQVIGFDDTPALCAECITLPGWYEIPMIRKMLDPTMEDPHQGNAPKLA